MTDKKYTDEEIKKALECCRTLDAEACEECPAESDCLHIDLNELALDLINRQQAEIERLQKAGEEAVSCFNRMNSLYTIKCMELKVAEAQAIKEFAESIKAEIREALKSNYKAKFEIMAKPNVDMADEFISYREGKIAALRGIDDFVDTLISSETKTEKCDCFCKEQRIKGWLDSNTPIIEPITVCNGTRERDECTCGGDKSKCDFYAKDYSYGY